jgi:hypothetical protein
MRRELLVLGLFIFLSGGDATDLNISEWMMHDIWYLSEDDVKGSGMFARYSYLGPIGPHNDTRITQEGAVTSIEKREHGSGTIENEQISFMERINHWVALDQGWNSTAMRSQANIKENNSMVFSPHTMTVGLGYYARNPIVFSSLLNERTSAKNHAAETSMIHATNRAKAIDKDLEAFVTDSYYDLNGGIYWEGSGTGLNIAEDVTEGASHIGVLQGNAKDNRYSAWKDPTVDIDQSFLGTYRIDTKMELIWPNRLEKEEDDWLNCCHGGWKDMNYLDKRPLESAEGIFDCTCSKAPFQAQFPEA